MKNWNWTNSILLLFVLLFACFVFTSYFIFFFQQRETFFFFFFFLHENEIDIACRKEHKEGGQGAVVTRFVNCEYRRGKSVARLRTTQGLKRVYYCKAADDEARNCAPERCIPLYPPTPPRPSHFTLSFTRVLSTKLHFPLVQHRCPPDTTRTNTDVSA